MHLNHTRLFAGKRFRFANICAIRAGGGFIEVMFND